MYYVFKDPNDEALPFILLQATGDKLVTWTGWESSLDALMRVPPFPLNNPAPLTTFQGKYEELLKAETLEELKLLILLEI